MQDTRPRIFISYSSADRQEAQKILDLLGAAGLGSWFDDLNISGGAMWSSSIVEAIKECSAMILLCTPRSVSSRNVHQEIQLAWEHNRPILPLILEASPLDPKIEYALAGRQYISVTNVGQEIWLPKVLRALHECGVELDRKILARIGNMNAPSSEPDIDFLPPPTNLPHSVSETIGRERELAELEQRISNARIVTLTGTGGTGKTRLSIDTGRQVLNHFKGGVFFVPLAPIIEPALVASAIAQSLDIREVQGQPLIASIKAFIYKKHLLLILDNFEHLLSARHTVSELLESCPNLKIIVTSRVHLGVRGEHEYHVEPLGLPTLTATKEELSASPAAQLFIERAKESRFNFEVTPEDVEPINKICHKLDGLPLAIELAASRIRMFNTRTILTRLEEWKNFLSSGSADQPERHKTLYNAIEWSYNLLRPEERSLFNLLCVFSGGFSIESAEALVKELGLNINVLDVISTLVDNSLVRIDIDSKSSSRFMVLETLREFALERLKENGEEENVRRAHAEVFANLAEQAEIPLLDNLKWDHIIEQEIDNIRAALRWGITTNHAEIGMRIMGGIGTWFFRGSVAESKRWGDELYKITNDEPPSLPKAKLLKSMGQIHWGIGDVGNCVKYLLEGLECARLFDDKWTLCDALTWGILGNIGNLEGARAIYDEAFALAVEINSLWHKGLSNGFRGAIEGANMNLTEMSQYLRKSGEYSKNIPWIRGAFLMLTGADSIISQRIEEGTSELKEALELLIQVRDQKNIIATYSLLAGIDRLVKNYSNCSTTHKKAILLCQETGELGGLYSHLCGISLLCLENELTNTAIKVMAVGDSLRRNTGATPVPLTDILTMQAPERIEELKSQLDPAEFEKAWSEGAKLSTNEAIEYACGVLDAMELSS